MTKISYGEPTSKAYKDLIQLYRYDGKIDLPTFKNKLFEMIDESIINEYIKIYMYPKKYDDTSLTDFLIKHSKLPNIQKNPEYSSKIKRPNNSLCFMLFSDY